ncbi:MAG TPA: GNAT family N-acetyltransferase [Burkholderiales bacterium]|nr:GNAT family N-acetyltransferase [Burkholderiales bacterium]
MSNDPELPVVHNEAAKRFEVSVDGRLAFSKYLLAGEKFVVEHTEVPPELEGRGLASRIVRTALDYARANRLKVMPLCPFTAAYIRKHPEYRDLVIPGYRY